MGASRVATERESKRGSRAEPCLSGSLLRMACSMERRWRRRKTGEDDGVYGEDDSPTPFPEPIRNEEQDRIDDALEYLKSHSAPSQALLDRILAYVSDDGENARLSLLDLGCGGGRMTLALAPYFAKVYARDPDPEMIELCRTIARSSSTSLSSATPWDIGLGDSRDSNIHGNCIDCIVAANCAHLWDWESGGADDLYAHFADVLRPGGSLIVTGARPLLRGYAGSGDTSDDTHLAHAVNHLPDELQIRLPHADSTRYRLGFQDMYATLPLPSDAHTWDIQSHTYERWTCSDAARSEWTLGEIIDWLRSLAPFRALRGDDVAVAAAQLDMSLNRDVAARVVREACERDGVQFGMGIRVKMVKYECIWAIKRRMH